MLGHKTILNKFKQIEIMPSISLTKHGIKAEINAKDITRISHTNNTSTYSYKNLQQNANKPKLLSY